MSSYKSVVLSLFLMSIRMGSLLSKFALTLFIARFLSFDILGMYGLIVSATMIVPSILNLSVPIWVGREIVSISQNKYIEHLSNYFLFYLINFSIVLIFSAAIGIWCDDLSLYIGIGLIISLGSFNHDGYNLLTHLTKPLIANIIHFFRSAFWIIPYMGFAYFYEDLRNIKSIILMWGIAEALAFLATFVSLNLKSMTLSHAAGFIDWLIHSVKSARFLYIGSVCNTIFQYIDRYVITFFLGLESVGIYIFYVQIASVVCILLQTGVIQLAKPQIIKYVKIGKCFSKLYNNTMIKSLGYAISLSVMMIISLYYLLPYLDKPIALKWFGIIFPISLGVIFQVFLHVQGIIFYANYREDLSLKINIIFMPIILLLYIFSIHFFDLWGAAASFALAVLFKILIQRWFLQSHSLMVSKDINI